MYAVDLRAVYRPAHKALHGKYVVAWCDGTTSNTDGYGRKVYRFAVGDALFDTRPTLAQVRARKPNVLVRTLDDPRGRAEVLRISEDDELDRGVTLLGELTTLPALTPKQIRQGDDGEWLHVGQAWHLHHRHEHDAAAMQRARDTEDAKQATAAAALREKRRAGGLAGMARRTLARDLTSLVSKARATGLRAILARAIREQLRLALPREKKKALQHTVEALNAYDEKHGNFVETPEREALMTCLEDIAAASGLGEMTEQLNEWRDG